MAKTKTPKTRMNDQARHSAGLALLIHGALDRAMAMAQRSDDLAERVRQEMFTPEEHKLLKKIPASWLPQESHITHINAGGWKVSLSYYRQIDRVEAVKKITSDFMGYRYYGSNNPIYYLPQRTVPQVAREGDYIIKDTELAAAVQQFVQDLKAQDEETSTLFRQINSTIQGFRYLEDLLEAIPDLNTLAPDLKTQAIPAPNALVTTAESLMCSIAKMRGDERDGCCDGKRIADNENTEPAQAA